MYTRKKRWKYLVPPHREAIKHRNRGMTLGALGGRQMLLCCKLGTGEKGQKFQ